MSEHNALGYWSGLALCLTKVRSSRARCPATALNLSGMQEIIFSNIFPMGGLQNLNIFLPFHPEQSHCG